MKKSVFLGIVTVVVASLWMVACKTYQGGVGPEYFSAPEGFAVKENKFYIDSAGAQLEKVNFADTLPHYFTAEFTHRVDWSIKVTGLVSKAVKELKGSSDKLDLSNTKWRGGHSGLFFFRKNETCVAELTFLGSKLVVRDTFTITNPINFHRPSDGIILVTNTSFENGRAGIPITFASRQFSFLEGATDAKSVNKYYDFGGQGSVEGNLCYYLANTPNNKGKETCDNTNYFAGAIQHRYFNLNANGSDHFLTTWTDPNNIWVNVYIYGNAETRNSQTSFQLHEADLSNAVNKPIRYNFTSNTDENYCKARVCEMTTSTYGETNNASKHDPPSDDSYEINIIPDVDGWKLYSVPLKDINAAVGKNAGSAGNKIKEPNRIARVQLGLVARQPSQFSATIVDFATVTWGGPFNPDKY